MVFVMMKSITLKIADGTVEIVLNLLFLLLLVPAHSPEVGIIFRDITCFMVVRMKAI